MAIKPIPKPRPLPPPPAEPMRFDADRLPFAKVMLLERLAGVRLSNWDARPSDGQFVTAVVAVLYDADFDLVAEALTQESLPLYVDLSGGEDDDPGNG